jgi:ribosomal protein S18 acetylase RimI-like enzyme
MKTPVNLVIEEASDNDVPAIRKLVNLAYKELADRGWNYTATYQDEDTTRERISKGKCFVLRSEGEIVATIIFKVENHFTGNRTAYLSQLAVHPNHKKNGIGTMLMDFCENLAIQQGFDGIQLDTAKPADHLVNWYLKREYRIVGETRWEKKTYESFIFEKALK